MSYLGLSLGARILNCLKWNHVIDLFGDNLSLWKAKYLSMGGHLTLTKLVPSSILIYHL